MEIANAFASSRYFRKRKKRILSVQWKPRAAKEDGW
jgi:hypothetical protein